MRKVIIIGVRPGELAGDESRMYHAPVYAPPVKMTRSGVIELQEQKDPVPLLENGKPVTVPHCGARPPGHHGKDDPGDPGIPTFIFRVAFWIPVEPGREQPLSNKWQSAAQVPNGKENATLDELAALRAGKFVEVVLEDPIGQRHATESQESLRAALLAVWDRLVAERAGIVYDTAHSLIGLGA